jgi:hypothetical protein
MIFEIAEGERVTMLYGKAGHPVSGEAKKRVSAYL